MSISKRRFSVRAFLASLFFIFVTVLGIFRFEQALVSGDRLPLTSVINIAADIACMALGYVLFICCVIDKSKNEDNLNYYLLMLFTTFCNAFLDEICWLVDGNISQIYLNVVANTLYYMGAPVLAYLFWRYVVTYLGIEHKHIRIIDKILVTGLMLDIVSILLNPPFGYYFIVKGNGFYERTPYYLISLIYPYVTIILTLILVILANKRFKDFQIITLFLYAFFPVAIGVLTIFTYGLSLSSPVIMLVLLLMYCVLNVIQSRERTVTENELEMATTIQVNMLPHVFPAFPDRNEFDLYASMTPAKEVGGDFYDFYMPDDDHLVITIADVSGKGIPAALMMMVTKTIIKNRGLTDFENCGKILATVNDQLCESNDMNMFVTVWIGVLKISTGELKYANAGHEYPAILRDGNKFELIKDRHSPPIGCMEGIPYKEQSMTLKPGDVIYIYTDGVTEANNAKNELFGEKRMLEALDLPCGGDMMELDRNVRAGISSFIGNTPQFDDITMLSLKYNGSRALNNTDESEPEVQTAKGDKNMKKLSVKADVNSLSEVQAFVDQILEENECSMKAQMQIDIAVEELFVNIAHYAYPSGVGDAIIEVDTDSDAECVKITFEDQGVQYDPLKHEDPDVTLSAEDRDIGGLGIFMVKQSMDDMSYEYVDNKNRLTITKKIR